MPVGHDEGQAESTMRRAGRRVTVVIPAKNEAKNIGWVVERLPSFIDELVIVDGRSTDRTVDVVLALRPDAVIVNDERPGKGAALRAGFAAASGDYVVMLDADGSMDPLEIEHFIEALDRGADLAKGSRFLDGGGTADMSYLREAGNRGLLILANLLFGAANTDLCYGFAAFRRHEIIGLDLDADGFEIETQLFMRATRQGLRVVEVPSFEAPRRSGLSNLNTFRDGWRVLMTMLRERGRPGTPMVAQPREGSIEHELERIGAFHVGSTVASVPVETLTE
jgi:glycosyltransferase involved in cell wall biosynthesis